MKDSELKSAQQQAGKINTSGSICYTEYAIDNNNNKKSAVKLTVFQTLT